MRRSLLLLALAVCASMPAGAIADDKPAAKPAADPAKPARPAEAAPAEPSAPAGSRAAAGSTSRAGKVKVDYVVAIVNDAIILNNWSIYGG